VGGFVVDFTVGAGRDTFLFLVIPYLVLVAFRAHVVYQLEVARALAFGHGNWNGVRGALHTRSATIPSPAEAFGADAFATTGVPEAILPAAFWSLIVVIVIVVAAVMGQADARRSLIQSHVRPTVANSVNGESVRRANNIVIGIDRRSIGRAIDRPNCARSRGGWVRNRDLRACGSSEVGALWALRTASSIPVAVCKV
jgi:hypothetical protein